MRKVNLQTADDTVIEHYWNLFELSDAQHYGNHLSFEGKRTVLESIAMGLLPYHDNALFAESTDSDANRSALNTIETIIRTSGKKELLPIMKEHIEEITVRRYQIILGICLKIPETLTLKKKKFLQIWERVEKADKVELFVKTLTESLPPIEEKEHVCHAFLKCVKKGRCCGSIKHVPEAAQKIIRAFIDILLTAGK
jgi:hypothetical protein